MLLNPIHSQNIGLQSLSAEKTTSEKGFQLPSSEDLPPHQKPEKGCNTPIPPERFNVLLAHLKEMPPHAAFIQSLAKIPTELSQVHSVHLISTLLKEVLNGNA